MDSKPSIPRQRVDSVSSFQGGMRASQSAAQRANGPQYRVHAMRRRVISVLIIGILTLGVGIATAGITLALISLMN